MGNIKKFEDFLDKMRGLLDNAKKQGHIIVRVEDIENTFPELKESGDEQIRKVLVGWFKRYKEQDTCGSEMFNGIPTDNILTWLEKQVEQKSAWSEEDNMMIEETLYFLREYQHSNRCKDESDMQNSVTCREWLKSLKQRIGG